MNELREAHDRQALDDQTSVKYDGGGAYSALQLEADSAAVVAGGAAVIAVEGNRSIDITLVNAASGESCTLLITEYSEATPTVLKQTGQVEREIPATDLVAEVNLGMVGPNATTGYAKAAVNVPVKPGHFVVVSLAAESASGAKYLRYQLLDYVSGSSKSLAAVEKTVAKGGLAGANTAAFLEKSNPTIIDPGVTINAVPLAADVPYITATVYTRKPVSGALNESVANLAIISICGAAEDITGAFDYTPGQFFALPPNGNLNQVFLAVRSANDGVMIVYTV